MIFADDIVLFTESEEHLENILAIINDEGMKYHFKKVMCNLKARVETGEEVGIEYETIKVVNEYIYLRKLPTPKTNPTATRPQKEKQRSK